MIECYQFVFHSSLRTRIKEREDVGLDLLGFNRVLQGYYAWKFFAHEELD